MPTPGAQLLKSNTESNSYVNDGFMYLYSITGCLPKLRCLKRKCLKFILALSKVLTPFDGYKLGAKYINTSSLNSLSLMFLSCFQTNWTMKRVLTTKRRETMMRMSLRERETKGKRYVKPKASNIYQGAHVL